MRVDPGLLLLIAAFVLFCVAVWKEKTFTAAGLACAAAAFLLSGASL